ncbi:putative integral membrane sensor domain protein [Serratia sp. FGI94]|uniref:MASE1 domain-containing protein n=1 Tax=Serratia sp. FGI94 TaxID=671990 RepID=UPI0002A6F85F|nr:MASE1 domain-containing protein [Serratia sp. FGI94]AGB84050.1 putative integral membrane sensor domain protein [Serratia sp. FGI94]
MNNWRKGLGYWLAFVVVYFSLAMISLETRDPWSLSSAVWLPAGLVLGTLCSSPRIYWPIWGVSAGLLHIFASLHYGRSIDIALVFALVDLVVIFPLAMVWYSIHHYFRHFSYRSESVILLTGVYVSSVLGGVFSTLALTVMNYPVVLSHFFTWALSNATGCLSSAPFFIIHRFVKKEKISFSLLRVFFLSLVAAVFFLPGELLQSYLLSQALLYLVLGLSVVFTAWLPLRILSIYFMFLTLLVSLSTLYGYGPLATGDQQGVQASQLYLLTVITLGLIVAARGKEFLLLNTKMRQQLALLDNALHQQQPVFFQLSANATRLSWLCGTPVFGIPVEQIRTLPLLLARIHPEDRAAFAECLLSAVDGHSCIRQSTFRLLLPDSCYHRVGCNLLETGPSVDTLGLFMLYT